ncbi:MAG: hypothetical protein OXH04_18420 [Acidobacteria bacterium]|nr:hypothetical protein [Acidobacteriota bacterium]
MPEADSGRRPPRITHLVIVGAVRSPETIARGGGIREIRRLRRTYGAGAWRKRKGRADVVLPDGVTRSAEVHWYEAHGKGRFEFKIKRYLE